jgi:hypothetical protein
LESIDPVSLKGAKIKAGRNDNHRLCALASSLAPSRENIDPVSRKGAKSKAGRKESDLLCVFLNSFA